VVEALAILAAAQGAQVPAEVRFDCRLAAADGSLLSFRLDKRQAEGRTQIRLRPAAGAWPGRDTGFLTANATGFAVTTGQLPLNVEFSDGRTVMNRDWEEITIFMGQDGERALPIAYGFCTEASIPDMAGAPGGTDVFPTASVQAVTTEAGTSANCHLVARDGRRARFVYNAGAGVITPSDSSIWSGRQQIHRSVVPPPPPRGSRIQLNPYAILSPHRGVPGPLAFEMGYLDPGAGRAIALLKFLETNRNGEGSTAALGICRFRTSQ
jgi:hypothetical protein